MTRTLTRLGICLTLVLCLVASPWAVRSQAPPATGVVSGVVLSADARRQPVRRVVVTLAGAELPIGRSSVTDDDGRFSLSEVPAGRFTLTATKPAYLPAAYGAARPGRPGIPISLTAGQRLTNLTIAIMPGAAIGGTIRDQKGQPAQGAQVQAVRALPGGAFEASASTTYADDRGQYRFFGLVPGEYVVATTFGASVFTSEVGKFSSAEIDAMLAALARGQAAASPPAAPAVTVPPASTVNPAPVFYPGVPNGAQASKVRVDAGEDHSGTDITLQLARTATVEGVIVSPSGPVPTVTIAMTQNGPDLPILLSQPSLQVRPGADGRFRFTSANPGSYTIQVRTTAAPPARGGGPTGPPVAALWARADVEVNGENLTGITLALQPGLHLAGRVVFDGVAPPSAADVARLGVSLSNAADTALRRLTEFGVAAANSLPSGAMVGPDGQFDVAGLPPGTYNLTATQVPAGWWLRSAMVAGKDVLDTSLEISPVAAALTPAVLTFSDRRTTLSGTLQTPAAQTASAYFIVVYPADRALWRAPSRRIQTTRAGTDGRFAVRDLPAGDYLIAALNDFEPDDLLDPAFYAKLVAASAHVTLGEGEQRVQDLRIGG